MHTRSINRQSLIFGLLGVAGFSLTLPATRLAVVDLDPTFVGLGRALVAAALAGMALWLTRAPKPQGRQWLRLGVIALGVVIGFPLFSSWAMHSVPASHGAVVIGLLPLSTALFGALLAGERPPPLFWASTLLGSAVIAAFSLASGGYSLQWADVALVAAVVAAGLGYAEGARLAKELGAWQTISWALLIAAPLLVMPVFYTAPVHITTIGWASVAGFLYVSIVSMFLAFFAWYHALALGGIARIGQMQLLQPFMTIVAAALLLGESISWVQVMTAVIVLACVFAGRRSLSAPVVAAAT